MINSSSLISIFGRWFIVDLIGFDNSSDFENRPLLFR